MKQADDRRRFCEKKFHDPDYPDKKKARRMISQYQLAAGIGIHPPNATN